MTERAVVGVAAKVVLFFKENPEERLTLSDVAMKFSVRPQSVRACMQVAVERGLVVWGFEPGFGNVYAPAGTALQAPAKGRPTLLDTFKTMRGLQ